LSVEAIKAAKEQATVKLEEIPLEADRDLLLRYAALADEKKRRATEERILYYRPHPKQASFHTAGAKYRLRCASGGNRSGKTEVSMAEVVAHVLGHRPWLPKDHPDYTVIHPMTGLPFKRAGKPVRILVVGESFGEQVAKVLLLKLLGNPEANEGGLLPRKYVRSTKKNQQGIISEIRITDGSVIYFKSYEQDKKLFESENYDAVALDEPPPREHYIAIARGCMDSGAPIWMAFTPLSQAWIHDELWTRDDVFKIHFDVADNVGYGLTQANVDEIIKDYSEEEKEMRVHGKFFHLGGLVYKEFGETHLLVRPDRHKWKWPIDGRYRYLMHLDPHKRKRHKAVWVAIRPDDTYLVIGEAQTPPDDNRISTMAPVILDYEKTFLQIPSDEIERLIDPASKEPGVTGEVETSVLDDLDACGLVFKIGSKKRATAISWTKELLFCKPDEGVFPRLYVFKDCSQIRYEFGHYQWEEWKGKDVQERKDPNPDPRKKHDDYIEGLHRIILETYVPRIEDDESDRHGYPVHHYPVVQGFSTGY
jgi:phage terminase large subunit-like protein